MTGDGGTEPDAIAGGFRSGGTQVAVICSDAAGLKEHGPAVALALADAGADEIFVVGRPDEAGATAGVKEYLYEGCDVLTVLRGLMKRMGVLDR